MKYLLGMVALLLLTSYTLFGFSGAGTLDSPFQIGTVSGTVNYDQDAIAQGSATHYYSFNLPGGASANSVVGLFYPSTSSGYGLSLYKQAFGYTHIGDGAVTYFVSGSSVYAYNKVVASSGLAAGKYILAISAAVNSTKQTSAFTIHFGIIGGSASGPASNDNISFPVGFPAAGGVRTGSNVGATKQANEPNHAGNKGGASLWYIWQPQSAVSSTVSAVFRTAGSSFDTLLAVYSYSQGQLQDLVSNDDEGNGLKTSSVAFSASVGTTYYIAVDGKNGATGNIVLSLGVGTGPTKPVNQTPANGAGDVNPSPTLVGSTFDSTSGMKGSQWILKRVSDGSIYKTYLQTASSTAITLSGLPTSTAFSWQVRYWDTAGHWSGLSSPTTFTTASVWPPQVSVNATQAMAIRGLDGSPAQSGTLRFTRTTTSGTMTLHFTVGGSALEGYDYQTIPASVTFQAGETAKQIVIDPIVSATNSMKRNVEVDLDVPDGYVANHGRAYVCIRNSFTRQSLVCRFGNQFTIYHPIYDVNNLFVSGSIQTVTFGDGSEKVYTGDFDGDGQEDLILRLRSGVDFQVDTTMTGTASASFVFGPATATCFVCDYNGDGRDDIIMRKGKQFYVDIDHVGTATDAFAFGDGTEQLVLRSDKMHTADWDGDGCEDIVLRSGNLYKIRSSSTGQVTSIYFGLPTDQAFLADMNGDGKADLVVVRGDGVYRVTVSHKGGQPDLVIPYGAVGTFATTFNLGDRRTLPTQDVLMLRKQKINFLIDAQGDGHASDSTIQLGTGTPGEGYFPIRSSY